MPKVAIAKLPVSKNDLENLRASGLTDETIRANGLHSERDSMKLATLLNRLPERPGKEIPQFLWLGGLVIPYYDLQEKNGFCRIRPLVPRTRNGESVKYEHPVGEPCRAYLPKASRAKLRNGESIVHFTEGEKKTLLLSQVGFLAVGLGGVWCWKKKGTDELIDDLAAICWKDRVAYIVFDYDKKAATRQQTALAAKRLAKALRKAGAKEVYIVDLPPTPDGEKQGVDDFVVRCGPRAYSKLVEQAQPAPILNAYQPITKAEGRTDTTNAARLVAKHGEDVRWVGPWDKWLIWDGTHWKKDQALGIDLKAKDIAADLFTEIAAVLREDKQ